MLAATFVDVGLIGVLVVLLRLVIFNVVLMLNQLSFNDLPLIAFPPVDQSQVLIQLIQNTLYPLSEASFAISVTELTTRFRNLRVFLGICHKLVLLHHRQVNLRADDSTQERLEGYLIKAQILSF